MNFNEYSTPSSIGQLMVSPAGVGRRESMSRRILTAEEFIVAILKLLTPDWFNVFSLDMVRCVALDPDKWREFL